MPTQPIRPRVGLDFDNTIVRYDRLFHRAALDLGLIPPDLPMTKGRVRDYLREVDREDEWTKLQGYVYGARMREAEMFPGVMECLATCRKRGIEVFIISHKTTSPYLGPHYDLHQSARDWLKSHGFYDPGQTSLTPEHVFFELTKDAKLRRIGDTGCSVFLDDLPEFLAEPAFPDGVRRVLFDPVDACERDPRFEKVKSWSEFTERFAS
jgi:hypothetical protein